MDCVRVGFGGAFVLGVLAWQFTLLSRQSQIELEYAAPRVHQALVTEGSAEEINETVGCIPNLLIFTYKENLLLPSSRALSQTDELARENVKNTIRLHPKSRVLSYDDDDCRRLLHEFGIVGWPSAWRLLLKYFEVIFALYYVPTLHF